MFLLGNNDMRLEDHSCVESWTIFAAGVAIMLPPCSNGVKDEIIVKSVSTEKQLLY